MSEQSTEVKGFKNTALGKVLFKIAAVAGLQEALNGKAAASHTHVVTDIKVGGMPDVFVTSLPSNPVPGRKVIYFGSETNGLVFGQTYKYKQTGEYSRTILVSGVLTNTNFNYVKQVLEEEYNTGTISPDQPPQEYDQEEYCMFDDQDITIHQSRNDSTYEDWGHDLLDVKNLLEGVGLTVNMYDSDDTTPSEAWTPVFALKSELPAES